MKNSYCYILFIVLYCLQFTNVNAAEPFVGRKADELVKGAACVYKENQSNIPSFITFREESRPAFNSPDLWLKLNFGMDAGMSLTLLSSDRDQIGFTHYRYKQNYNGIPIEGTMWLVHVKNGQVVSMNGMLLDRLKPNLQQSIPESEALNKALAFVPAEKYKWQMPEEEQLLKRVQKNPAATYYPKGELVYSFNSENPKNASYKLAYKFDIYADKPLARKYISIDALSGEVIDVQDRIHEVNTNGIALTGYSGTQNIVTDSVNATTYRLRENGRGAGQGMETYNMLTGTNYGAAVDFTDNDNYWNNANAAKDQYATDAHFATEMTYDYFYTRFGRNSIDNAGFKLISYVHYSSNYVNAFWDGSRMTYGDGNGTYNPLTSLDIGGHEITHGLTSYTANLIYSYESGALNESFSDCFGTAVEWFADPANGDWLIGEDIGSAFRSHSNPNTYGDPDTYLGTNWYTGTGDNGGVHSNSGVQNYWFYLLSVGGSGTNDIGNAFNVTGLGINKAAAIAFRTLTVYLTPSSQYADARLYSIQSAIDLYGNCSQEMFSTIDAWYAVGIGTSGNNPTTIAAQGPTTFCNGSNVLLASAAPFGSTFQWYKDNVLINGETNVNYSATTSGDYYVVTNSCGTVYTSNTISVSVITLTPTVNPSAPTSSCTSVDLTANNTSGYNIQWNKNGVPISGATSTVYSASSSGNYSFTLNATVVPTSVFNSSGVISIPDNSCTPPAISTISVSGMPASVSTGGISITINVTHTYDGDLHLMLEAPNGDVLGLSREAGGSGDNFVNTTFSDAGSGSLSGGTAPFTGTYKPWLSTFTSCINTTKTSFASIGNGSINPNGNWRFHAYDRYGIDVGTINSWSITFPGATTPSPNCGPVTSPATTVTIGSFATLTLSSTSTLAYQYTTKNNFSGSARAFGTAVTLNDKGYYGLGNNTLKNDWWEYNSLTDSWTQKSNCPQGLIGAASFGSGTKAYIVGGYNGATYVNTTYEWNSSSNSWSTKTAFPGSARAYMVTGVSAEKGYIICGSDASNSFADIWEYNPALDQWTFKTNVPGAASSGRMKMTAFNQGPKIYFGLGQTCGIPCTPVYSNEWFEYDPINNIVLAKANFPGTARENANGFSLGEKGYVMFGNSGSTDFTDYWEYDVVQNLWNLLGNYSGSGRTGASAIAIKNAAYIFGGNVSSSPVTQVLQFKVINKVCTNSPATVSLQASNGISYLWNTGATTQAITGMPTGDYSVIVNNSGCNSTAYLNLEVYSLPTASISAGGPTTFCTGSSVTLTSTAALAYLWSNGSTTGSITVSNTGSYTVIVTGAGGCTTTSAPVTVTSNPGPPATVLGNGPLTFCQGGSVTLNTYNWQSIPYAPLSGSGTQITLGDDQLSGSLPIGFSFNFFNNNYSNFYISSNGFITFGATSSGCCSGQVLPNALSPNNLIAFAWTDLNPPAGGSIEYFTTGTSPNRMLIVKYTNIPHYPSGNLVNAQVVLFETSNLIEIHTGTMPSDGTPHTMGLENINGTQAVAYPGRNGQSWSATNNGVRFGTNISSYLWSNGATTSGISVNASGQYSVIVTDRNGCIATSSQVAVTVNPLPVATITASQSTALCPGESVTLTVSSASSYLWNTGATSQSIVVNTAGSYSATVTSADGCTQTSAPTNVTVGVCTISLNLKVYIEGYYLGSGIMEAAPDKIGHPNLCDTIIVELHDAASPYNTLFADTSTIDINGNGSFIFPGSALSNSYYVVVKHRNSLETWSAAPVSMIASTNYDFTTLASKAYGNNLIETADHTGWAIYSGDISSANQGIGYQDGIIESQDYSDMENAINFYLTGYVFEDITGDGIVESLDYSIMENNIAVYISIIRP